MSLYSIQNQLPVFLNKSGSALNAGKIYFGLPGQDPQTFPKAVYWDEAGADPVDQVNGVPVIGGYITRAGSPATVYINGAYSIRVLDRFGALVFYFPTVTDLLADFIANLAGPDGANLVGFSQDTDAITGSPGGPPNFEQAFTATDGQTDFTLAQVVAGYLWVFVNGARIDDADFSVADLSLALAEPCDAGDSVRVADFNFSDLPDTEPDPGTVAAKLQQFPNPLDYPWLAPTGGLIDARDELLAADARGPAIITGNHRVSSSMTFSNRPMFILGGRLTIDTGATVTFSDGYDAGERQIFFGNGSVAGLSSTNVAHFAGSLLNAASDAVARIQKAYDACVNGAKVIWPVGYFSFGATPVSVLKGQASRGAGKKSTLIKFLTTTTKAFICDTVSDPIFDGIGFTSADANSIPTTGVVIEQLAAAPHMLVTDCGGSNVYEGIRHNGVNGAKVVNTDFNDCIYRANSLVDGANIHITGCNNSAFSDWFNLSSTAGFIAGESITWTGGSGSYGYTTSDTRAKCIINDLTPADGTLITGSTSGATATVTSIVKGHQGGGLSLYGNSPGNSIQSSAWAGGAIAGIFDGPLAAHGNQPEYCNIMGCYFDHSDQGTLFNKAAGMMVIGTWFSARAGDGLSDFGTHNKFIGCHIAHSWNNGTLQASSARFHVAVGNSMEGNNRSNNGKCGAYVDAGATDFAYVANAFGGQTASGFGGTQTYPIRVVTGASDRYVITYSLSFGTVNAVDDLGSGVNKAVGDNF